MGPVLVHHPSTVGGGRINASHLMTHHSRITKPKARHTDTVHPGATNFIDLVDMWTQLTTNASHQAVSSSDNDTQRNNAVRECAVEELEGDLRLIAEYFISESERVLVARGIPGGWEAWLQTELAIYLAMAKGDEWTIGREKAVFDHTKQRIDIWMEPRRPTEKKQPARHPSFWDPVPVPPGAANVGIELKVETKHTPTSNPFWAKQPLRARLQGDVDKCKAGLKTHLSTNDSLQQTKLFCIGITASPDDVQEYRSRPDETAVLTRLCAVSNRRKELEDLGDLYMVSYEITCPETSLPMPQMPPEWLVDRMAGPSKVESTSPPHAVQPSVKLSPGEIIVID